MSARPTSDESRWGGPRTILGLVLIGAAALRLVGVRYGLPYGNILNPDEEVVVPRAWAITHGEGLDLHPFFDWPSLLFYVLAPFQWWQDEPSYLAARLVVVAVAVLGVGAAWWLGARSYGVVAGGVAGVATAVAGVHVAYSRVALSDILLTTLVTAALALLVTGRTELAAAVAGLATAAKWPGAVLAVPIVVMTWGQWRRLAIASVVGIAAFALATPFAFVHPLEALGDLWRVSSDARRGWLGFENDSFSAIAFTEHLWRALGPALVVAVLGLIAALVVRRPPDRVLAGFALTYFATLLPLGSHFDRYVLPLVPVLAVLAGRFRSLAPVTLLLLVVPFVWTVRDTAKLTKTDTRVAAVARIERLDLSRGVIAVDPGLPDPFGHDILPLELPLPSSDPDPMRSIARLRAVDVLATHVWVNGSVADRVRAAPDVYPEEVRFYANLERDARLVFRMNPGGELTGPWVAVYELPSAR